MDNNANDTNMLRLGNGATPLTVAELVTRECSDKEWLEDVIFYLQVYIKRTHGGEVE